VAIAALMYRGEMEAQGIRSMGVVARIGICALAIGLMLGVAMPGGTANAAPPSKTPSKIGSGVTQIAEAIRKRVKEQARVKGAQELMKAFGLNSADPTESYIEDAKVLDLLRSKPPMPMVQPAKQAEALADLYVAARLEGKGADAVEGKIDEMMKYATGKKPLHELNVPESERNRRKTCPHGRCTESMELQGRVSSGAKSYDQYECSAGHETLLRVN
jgi:hypothetical protein